MSATLFPDVNQKVAVRVTDWRGELYSRIEDFDARRIVIALPTDGVTVHTLARGREVAIEWITPRGLARVPGVVGDRTGGRVPMLVIDMTGETELVQRRDYVRAEAFVPVTVALARPDSRPVNGTTLDISGGGLRARVALDGLVDDRVSLAVELPDGVLEAAGRVTRRPDDATLAFQFTEISQHDRERLIRFVFQAHRRGYLTEKRSA